MAFVRGPKNFSKATADTTNVEAAPGATQEHFLMEGSFHNSGPTNNLVTLRFGSTVVWSGLIAADGGGSGVFNMRQPDGTGSPVGTNTAITMALTVAETVNFNYMIYTQGGN